MVDVKPPPDTDKKLDEAEDKVNELRQAGHRELVRGDWRCAFWGFQRTVQACRHRPRSEEEFNPPSLGASLYCCNSFCNRCHDSSSNSDPFLEVLVATLKK